MQPQVRRPSQHGAVPPGKPSVSSLNSSSSGNTNSTSTNASNGQKQKPLRLGPLPMDAHHVWFYGYVLFLAGAGVYLANVSLLRLPFLPSNLLYHVALVGLGTSLACTVHRTVRHWSLSYDTLDRLLRCDVTPYLSLVLLLLSTPPCPVALLPMLAYGVLHVAAFCRQNATIARSTWWRTKGERLAQDLDRIQDPLLTISAHLEILTLPWLVLSFALRRGATLTQLVVYVQFLRWQYNNQANHHNGGGQEAGGRILRAMLQWDRGLEALARHPSCPLVIARSFPYYRQATHYLSKPFSMVAPNVLLHQAAKNSNPHQQRHSQHSDGGSHVLASSKLD